MAATSSGRTLIVERLTTRGPCRDDVDGVGYGIAAPFRALGPLPGQGESEAAAGKASDSALQEKAADGIRTHDLLHGKQTL